MCTNDERDQLGEILKRGASHAAHALAQLIGKNVMIGVPIVHMDTIEHVAAQMGDPSAIMTAILMNVHGKARGVFFLMFPKSSAEKITGLMTGNREKEINVFDPFNRSALQEVGNILAGSSLAALSVFSGLSFLQSVPEVVTDTRGAILNSILLELGEHARAILLLNVKVMIDEEASGDLFFFFDKEAMTNMLSAVEQKSAP